MPSFSNRTTVSSARISSSVQMPISERTPLRTWQLHGSRKAMPRTTRHGLYRWDRSFGRTGPLRWRFATIFDGNEITSSTSHDVEPQHCADCGSDSPFGCLSCLNCGRLARVATDMRKASLLVRLENLAASFGFDLSLDMFPDDDIRARGGPWAEES